MVPQRLQRLRAHHLQEQRKLLRAQHHLIRGHNRHTATIRLRPRLVRRTVDRRRLPSIPEVHSRRYPSRLYASSERPDQGLLRLLRHRSVYQLLRVRDRRRARRLREQLFFPGLAGVRGQRVHGAEQLSHRALGRSWRELAVQCARRREEVPGAYHESAVSQRTGCYGYGVWVRGAVRGGDDEY